MDTQDNELRNGDNENCNEEIEVKQRTADIQVAEDFTFNKFMLSEKLLKSLNKLNFVKPSPVQLKVVPLAKSGIDMLIQAKSGTGKTLAFSICLLESYDIDLKFPQALIVVPTREIAVQIVGVLNDLGSNLKQFRACEFIGGTEVINDRKKIQSAKVVVGTPGRILHLIHNEIFNVSCLKALVLDEADKLLESGQMFKDASSILNQMQRKIQIIATTATVTDHLEQILKKVMKNPIGITPKQEIPVLLGIKQFVKVLPRETDNIQLMNAKIEELNKIFTRVSFKQCLLFTDSQSKTESYGNYLNKRGWKNEIISGAQDQSQRLHVLEKLIKFKCRILITTDLMSRGIDIENINLIINLDLPYDCCTYLHRIGRAGRFGSHGLAITFVNGEEDLGKFQRMLGDIGGESLTALKYPDEDVKYDFWNFEQNSENLLEAINGVSKKDNRNGRNNGIRRNRKLSAQNLDDDTEKTMIENLALLEITRKLVDDKSKPAKAFDLNEVLQDYQSSLVEPVENGLEKKVTNGHSKNAAKNEDENVFLDTIAYLGLYEGEKKVNGSSKMVKSATNGHAKIPTNGHTTEPAEDDIFLKTIADLGLYEDEQEENEVNGSGEIPDQPTEEKEVRRVIFQRTAIESPDDEMSSDISSSEIETESDEDEEDEDMEVIESECESENDLEEQPAKKFHREHDVNHQAGSSRPQRSNEFRRSSNRDKFRHAQPSHNGVFDSYNNYVANNYSRWQNIFYYQLANIQNYVQSERK